MEIGFHVKLRYVQRVMGIKNVKEAKRFIESNEFEVTYRVLEFVNKAESLIKNYAPARRDVLDYYINGETLIIIDPKGNELRTLFDVTLDVDNKQNSEKIKQYVKTIKRNNYEIKVIKIKFKKQNTTTDHLEYMINYLEEKIEETLMENIKKNRQESINICKDYAAKEKQMRLENRELMSEMFIKIEMK